MGTSKERVDTRADGTGPPAGVAVLLLALELIHAQGVALGLNAVRLEKALASTSVESSGDLRALLLCRGSMRAQASNSLQRGWTPLAVTEAIE
jgi:hypothetical protein